VEMLKLMSGNIVFDMDEVLVDIFPTVFEYMQKNVDDYFPYAELKTELKPQER